MTRNVYRIPSRGEVIPLHRGYITEAERQFNAELIAERDRLAELDHRPELFKELSEYDPYDQLGRKDHRVTRWQTIIAAACYVLAVFTVCYFAAQLGRGVL